MARLDLKGSRPAAVKLITITLPAVAIVSVALVLATEAWVRATFDPRGGTPGLYVADPARGMRLAPNYTGWFAGVPVQTNSLAVGISTNWVNYPGGSPSPVTVPIVATNSAVFFRLVPLP